MLGIGTHDGFYAADESGFEAPEATLDCGTVHVVTASDETGVLVAADDGLYHSSDGREWHALDPPRTPVVAVAVSPDENRCYAGTYPAHVYRLDVSDWSVPATDAWTECERFRQHPLRDRWADRSPRSRGSQVRTLAVHPDAPDRVVAGVEVGGVYVSDDRGATWTERSNGLHDDVHHVLTCSGDEYVAACGNGLYRTRDAGQTWVRLDTDFRDFWFNYYRETVAYDGRLYTSACGWGPAEGQGATFTVDADGTMARLPFPGAESSFVLSWAVDERRLFAGTMEVGETFRQHSPADVLRYDGDGWTSVGPVPAGVKSLAAY